MRLSAVTVKSRKREERFRLIDRTLRQRKTQYHLIQMLLNNVAENLDTHCS